MLVAGIRAGRALLLGVLMYVSSAAQTAPAVQEAAGHRLASRQEGEAVVWVAWELRRGLGAKPDCSHFVHLVYARAGLDYEYAAADAIFEGIDAFRRVPDPQPGDLVAWKGHVGIIVDPDEHSFYSSVRSGFAVEDYRSGYWLNRGQPRFYRYVTDEVRSARLAAHLSALPFLISPEPSLSGLPLPPEAAPPDLRGSSSSSARHETIAAQSEGDDAGISDIVFVSPHAKPSREEVRAALLRLADANGERVFRTLAPRSIPMLVVAEHVSVDALSVDDHFGWAELQAPGSEFLPCGSGDFDRRAARWRVSMRRDERGWILLAPRDRIYLRRGAAERALAGHCDD